MKKLLRDVLPQEFFDSYMEATYSFKNFGKSMHQLSLPREERELSPAAKLLDVEVVAEYGHTNNNPKPWPGKHKHVCVWWQLANGKAVAWNENPSKGWSFPVIGTAELAKSL